MAWWREAWHVLGWRQALLADIQLVSTVEAAGQYGISSLNAPKLLLPLQSAYWADIPAVEKVHSRRGTRCQRRCSTCQWRYDTVDNNEWFSDIKVALIQ